MLPEIQTPVPGAESQKLAERLRKVECRNTIYIDADWPIFWERAEGSNVWDVDGNRFVDLTSGFGVAGVGYGFTAGAMKEQSGQLIHAMGDVHPARLKVELCEQLSEITFGRWDGTSGKCLFGNSGFEAVEAALKTAVVATGRSGILSFEGGYHGLGYGALLGQGIDWFEKPFRSQIADVTQRLPFPKEDGSLEDFAERLSEIEGSGIGAVLLEPIQGRGGIIVPPAGFLKLLRTWCDEQGALLILDEIYTGFWRTEKFFACEWEEVVPDLICLGKALSGGFPISVCVGKSEMMDRWPATDGEALHTSTFLGNPVGCAMALAAIKTYRETEFPKKVEKISTDMWDALKILEHLPFVSEVRGRGLMIGICTDSGERVISAVKALLKKGFIALPDGPDGDVLALTPAFGISKKEIAAAIAAISESLIEAAPPHAS